MALHFPNENITISMHKNPALTDFYSLTKALGILCIQFSKQFIFHIHQYYTIVTGFTLFFLQI